MRRFVAWILRLSYTIYAEDMRMDGLRPWDYDRWLVYTFKESQQRNYTNGRFNG